MGEGGVKSLKKLPTSFMDGPQGGEGEEANLETQTTLAGISI